MTKPDPPLADFVDSFWLFFNHSPSDKQFVVLPDGRIDLLFYRSKTEPLRIVLLGLETQYAPRIVAANTELFAVSFKLLATDYIFPNTVANLLNQAKSLPPGFWQVSPDDLYDFDVFCQLITEKIQSFLPKVIERRKQRLFDLVYSSNGSLTVKKLSEKVGWSSRQINRYFNQQYGLSLKAYCSILRFKAALKPISEGNLFPEHAFTDQNHFIKTIKRYAGVTPKILRKNKDDRFYYLTALRNQPT
ncbi:helix-turn-helix domain-containing protein [Spirosoma radiotolerans]|nr:AraC family transcriptional regulator [Spirosoma radiotolerans]